MTLYLLIRYNSRYFYDSFEKKCVRFGACDDLEGDENNFESRQECTRVCIGNTSVYLLVIL